jgi:HAD superfamily hydrolase (TIGR01490 family)
MTERICFFDVDHTITRGSTGRRYAIAAARRGILRARHLAAIPLNYAAYRFGAGGISFFDRDFPALRGVELAVLEEVAAEVFERSIRASIRPFIAALIAEHKSRGAGIVLATSSLDFIVRPLAEHLGVDRALASRLEFVGGRCTGRFDGPPLFGEAKLDAVRRYATEARIALPDCAFYSDSVHDLPLLEAVGRPVAVAPDHRLLRAARSRGWEIIPRGS